jgi:hypothetical protein
MERAQGRVGQVLELITVNMYSLPFVNSVSVPDPWSLNSDNSRRTMYPWNFAGSRKRPSGRRLRQKVTSA